jgi:hypothetical protein
VIVIVLFELRLGEVWSFLGGDIDVEVFDV